MRLHPTLARVPCFALGLFLGLTAAFAAAADSFDWPQWQGPHRTNLSAETGLLQEWPEGGPTRLWTFDQAGSGYSGVAIASGTLYTMGTRNDSEILLALNANTGAELWVNEIDDILPNNWGKGPRGTPTIDGDRIYAMSGNGTLVCAKADTGELVWQQTMQSLGGRRPNWGYCESVLIDGGWCVCTPGGKQGTLAALDKLTGEFVWQSADITDGAQYASVTIADIHGVKTYLQLTMEHVFGVNAADGKLLWSSEWPGRTAVIPTPIHHNNSVYVTSGYSVGCKLVKISPDQQAEEIYANKNMKNHHGGVVLVGEHLYGYSDGLGWICQDFATGEVVWMEKKALGKGSLTYADGLLYCLSEDKGEVVLIAATPEGWQERGRMTLSPQSEIRSPQGRIWTHPVVCNGKLYLRDQEYLYCFDVKTQAAQ